MDRSPTRSSASIPPPTLSWLDCRYRLPVSIIYSNDALWSVGVSDISKIDPATNTIVATVHIQRHTNRANRDRIVEAGGSLWLMSEALGAELIQIDPATATIVDRVAFPDGLIRPGHAGSEDAVYICSCAGEPLNRILKLDLETEQFTAALEVPDIESDEYEADALWGYNRSGEATASRSPVTIWSPRSPTTAGLLTNRHCLEARTVH